MNEERSALDVLFDLDRKVELLSRSLKVVDDNIKLLNNKVIKFSKKIDELSNSLENINTETASIISNEKTESNFYKSGKEGGLVLGKIKVFGRIVDHKLNPISKVLIKIYNDKGDLIKTRNSDSSGYWDARLPEGIFNVEYLMKNFKPVNKKIFLEKEMETFEVK